MRERPTMLSPGAATPTCTHCSLRCTGELVRRTQDVIPVSPSRTYALEGDA